MSKHVSRKERWTRRDSQWYSSDLGEVRYGPDGWYAFLRYRTLDPPQSASGLPSWTAHAQRLGPYKRPRNAMIALEREATALRNHHGEEVHIGVQPGTDGHP
jgi:hypothetical protein